MVRGQIYVLVNWNTAGSAIGLVSLGNKPFPEPVSIQIYVLYGVTKPQ